MKVRQIRARRYAKAIPVVLKMFGPKCPTFDAECVVCQGNKMLRIHKRIPNFFEVYARVLEAGERARDKTYTDPKERARELEDFDMHTKGE